MCGIYNTYNKLISIEEYIQINNFAILPLAELTHLVNGRNLPKLRWCGNFPKLKWEKSPITSLLEKYTH
jgi:hypothetical protein